MLAFLLVYNMLPQIDYLFNSGQALNDERNNENLAFNLYSLNFQVERIEIESWDSIRQQGIVACKKISDTK